MCDWLIHSIFFIILSRAPAKYATIERTKAMTETKKHTVPSVKCENAVYYALVCCILLDTGWSQWICFQITNKFCKITFELCMALTKTVIENTLDYHLNRWKLFKSNCWRMSLCVWINPFISFRLKLVWQCCASNGMSCAWCGAAHTQIANFHFSTLGNCQNSWIFNSKVEKGFRIR